MLPHSTKRGTGQWTDDFAKMSGAFVAFADNSVGDTSEGTKLVIKLHDSKKSSEELSSGNRLMGTFLDTYTSVWISYK